jgi:hypothetical protein
MAWAEESDFLCLLVCFVREKWGALLTTIQKGVSARRCAPMPEGNVSSQNDIRGDASLAIGRTSQRHEGPAAGNDVPHFDRVPRRQSGSAFWLTRLTSS